MGVFQSLFWLLAIKVALVLLSGILLIPLAIFAEPAVPAPVERLLSEPLLIIILSAVIVGPLVEEVVFRSWLSGQPAILALAAVLICSGLAVLALVRLAPEAIGPGLFSIAILTLLSIAIFVGNGLQRSAPPRWFEHAFPLLFWLQALVFAALHVGSSDPSDFLITLPFVLPQLIGGTIWGYARLRHGLWAAVALHGIYNAIVFSGGALLQRLAPSLF